MSNLKLKSKIKNNTQGKVLNSSELFNEEFKKMLKKGLEKKKSFKSFYIESLLIQILPEQLITLSNQIKTRQECVLSRTAARPIERVY